MTELLKPVLKQLLPPFALTVARRAARRGPREWEYVASSWPQMRSLGWSDPSVAATQRAKWADFLALTSGTGPLGTMHEASEMIRDDLAAHHLALAYGYVLARAARLAPDVSVLDWGGGIGHYARLAQALLPEAAIHYTVKDLPELCRVGRDHLPSVTFVSEDEPCLAETYDLVFASGSMQYAEDWRLLLSRFARCARQWLYLTRLPLVSRAESFVVVQRPFAYGYASPYVSWVFNRRELLDHAARLGLTLEREFLIDERHDVAGAPERVEMRGFLFRAARRPS